MRGVLLLLLVLLLVLLVIVVLEVVVLFLEHMGFLLRHLLRRFLFLPRKLRRWPTSFGFNESHSSKCFVKFDVW